MKKIIQLLVVGLLVVAVGGCATRSYVDSKDDMARRYTQRRVLTCYSDLLEDIERSNRRFETFREAVLSSDEIRRQRHNAYWKLQFRAEHARLDELEQEIITEGSEQ